MSANVASSKFEKLEKLLFFLCRNCFLFCVCVAVMVVLEDLKDRVGKGWGWVRKKSVNSCFSSKSSSAVERGFSFPSTNKQGGTVGGTHPGKTTWSLTHVKRTNKAYNNLYYKNREVLHSNILHGHFKELHVSPLQQKAGSLNPSAKSQFPLYYVVICDDM